MQSTSGRFTAAFYFADVQTDHLPPWLIHTPCQAHDHVRYQYKTGFIIADKLSGFSLAALLACSSFISGFSLDQMGK